LPHLHHNSRKLLRIFILPRGGGDSGVSGEIRLCGLRELSLRKPEKSGNFPSFSKPQNLHVVDLDLCLIADGEREFAGFACSDFRRRNFLI
jgi:hypothetical protein